MPKPRKDILIALAIVVLAIGISLLIVFKEKLAAFHWRESPGSATDSSLQQENEQNELAEKVLDMLENAATVDTSSWITYRNERLGFELKHPPEIFNERGTITSDWDTGSSYGFHRGEDQDHRLYSFSLHLDGYFPDSMAYYPYNRRMDLGGLETTVYSQQWPASDNLSLVFPIPLQNHIDRTRISLDISGSPDALGNDTLAEIRTMLNSFTYTPIRSLYRTEPANDTGYGSECGDSRLVHFNEQGVRTVVEESMGALVAPMLDRQYLCSTSLHPLAFHENLGKLFFATNVYEGGGPTGGTLYEYDISAGTLIKLRINDERSDVERLSPDGLRIASVSYEHLSKDQNEFGLPYVLRAQEMKVFDLLSDTSRIVLDLNNEAETLVDSQDGYGPFPAFNWVDDTIKYSVFDATQVEPGLLGHPLKKTRLLSL